jgi:serine/threonine protein kinase
MVEKLCKEDKSIKSLMLIKESFILTRGEDKYVCMVMDLMAGSLYDVIKTDKYSDGLGEEITMNIQIQLMEALEVLHSKGIIHTDIKPENMLVCGINAKYQKIIDQFNKLKLKEKYDKNIDEVKLKYNLKNKNQKEKFKQDKYMILLELNKFIHDIINFDEILEDRTSELFSEDLIKDIKIKLADFGSILYEKELVDDDWFPEVTTRYYRDPKVILGLPYDKKIDLHSAVCTLHEIQTGQIKYNPDDLKDEDTENDYSTDYYHILLLLKDGTIKLDMLKLCKNEKLKDELDELIKKLTVKPTQKRNVKNKKK